MSNGPPVTTTTFAILGLLALRPMSSHELTQQMDRGMARYWPRAASKLYEEPKKLVALGLARDAIRTVRGRQRAVYSITPAGRKALRRWLASPGRGPSLECEQLLHVFFAEHGSKQDLIDSISAARAWADARTAENADIARGYASGAGLFPERLPHTLLVGRFLADFEDMVARWSDWARGIVDDWPDIGTATPDEATLAYLGSRAPQRSRSNGNGAAASLGVRTGTRGET
jgi:DNA-binding PadR family transcriptional regulator